VLVQEEEEERQRHTLGGGGRAAPFAADKRYYLREIGSPHMADAQN
jgi:hypothetical protein